VVFNAPVERAVGSFDALPAQTQTIRRIVPAITNLDSTLPSRFLPLCVTTPTRHESADELSSNAPRWHRRRSPSVHRSRWQGG